MQTGPSQSPGNLYALNIDLATGALTAVPGSPFGVGFDPEVIVFVN